MEADDVSIGPVFPEKNKYTRAQLLTFSKTLSNMQYNLSEDPGRFGKDVLPKFRAIFFDNGICRAQFLINTGNPSNDLLLRLFQRFLSCLKEHRVCADYEEWFIIKPSQPRIVAAYTETKPTPDKEKPKPKTTFDPNRQSTSKDAY